LMAVRLRTVLLNFVPPPPLAALAAQVLGVIRSKYLFKNRPTALISKPHQANKARS
jgi:hypothetical protein